MTYDGWIRARQLASSGWQTVIADTRPVADTHKHPAARHARGLCQKRSALEIEGVGNAGCPWHPQPRVRFALVEMHTSKRVPRNHPTFPHAMVLTVSFVLLCPQNLPECAN